jgi:hypothetical protein
MRHTCRSVTTAQSQCYKNGASVNREHLKMEHVPNNRTTHLFGLTVRTLGTISATMLPKTLPCCCCIHHHHDGMLSSLIFLVCSRALASRLRLFGTACHIHRFPRPHFPRRSLALVTFARCDTHGVRFGHAQ